MKKLLIIIYALSNTYVLAGLPISTAFKTIIEEYKPNSIGLDYKIQFSMKINPFINGDPSYCLGSLVVINKINYLVTSTGCLVRKGTKVQSNTYYATGYKIMYNSNVISAPINFKFKKMKEGSILFIKLPTYDTQQFPTNILTQTQRFKSSINLNAYYHALISSLIDDDDNTNQFNSLLFSQYYSKNNNTLYTQPVFIGFPFKGSPYNTIDESLVVKYLIDYEYYYAGIKSPTRLYLDENLKTSPLIFKLSNNSIIRDLGASLTICDFKYNQEFRNNNCSLVGILTGTINKYPYFSFFSEEKIYVLDTQTQEVVETVIQSLMNNPTA